MLPSLTMMPVKGSKVVLQLTHCASLAGDNLPGVNACGCSTSWTSLPHFGQWRFAKYFLSASNSLSKLLSIYLDLSIMQV